MFKYIFAMLSLILLCSVIVSAEEVNGDVFTIYNVPACYEVVLVQVVSNTPIPYTLVGCNKLEGDIYNWQCPCKDNISIAVPQGEAGQFDFRLQYYISKPRPVKNINATMLSQNELYNSEIIRVANVPNFLVNQNVTKEEEYEGDELVDFIFFLIIGLFALLIFGGLFYLILFGFRGKLKRWLRMDTDMLDNDRIVEEEDTGIKAFFMAIFRREDIKGKALVTNNNVQPIKKENKDDKIEQEALEILRSLEE